MKKEKQMSKAKRLKMKKPKILVYDIETSFIEVCTFSLYPESINPDNIINDWYIICAAWKWLGEKKVYGVSVLDDKAAFAKDFRNDLVVVKALLKVINEADIIIAHNGDRFDKKKLTARIIHHGLKPLLPITSIDTLKAIKREATFTSHRLDALLKSFKLNGKLQNQKGLWMRVRSGSKKAVRDMLRYNKVDVTILEDLYNYISPYLTSTPNIAKVMGTYKTPHQLSKVGLSPICPKCGHTESVGAGKKGTRQGRFQFHCCKNCGKVHQGKKLTI